MDKKEAGRLTGLLGLLLCGISELLLISDRDGEAPKKKPKKKLTQK